MEKQSNMLNKANTANQGNAPVNSAPTPSGPPPKPQHVTVHFADGTKKEFRDTMGFQMDQTFLYIKPHSDDLVIYRIERIHGIYAKEAAQPEDKRIVIPKGATIDNELMMKAKAEELARKK